MTLHKTNLPGVLRVVPRIFGDDRGYFVETYKQLVFRQHGIEVSFVQDNESSSQSGVLRGLHFQHPNDQGKLVRVLSGAIFDVAVDVRRGSPTFGEWYGLELNATTKEMLWLPPGFAHGFCVLGDHPAIIAYKCTATYAPQSEHTLAWDDPAIGVSWPIASPTLSSKDQNGTRLADFATADLPAFDT